MNSAQLSLNASQGQRGRLDSYQYSEFLIKSIEDRHIATNWIAVSLTLKQHLKRDDGTWQRLTYSEVQKCIKRLMKKLNLQSYGPAYRRHEKRLAIIPAIEKGMGGRLHVHLTLEVPCYLKGNEKKFFEWIRSTWKKMRWSDCQHKFDLLTSKDDVNRWTRYLVKEVGINEDAIDFENLYL